MLVLQLLSLQAEQLPIGTQVLSLSAAPGLQFKGALHCHWTNGPPCWSGVAWAGQPFEQALTLRRAVVLLLRTCIAVHLKSAMLRAQQMQTALP